ncbi:hypothetical protein [Sporosarcina sp. FSL W7-1283]|uniref:hypothetical protein n=1 Tax=Sporosarcina sp. FSL W7-1283 TaxID=2921560 RepID=UPI0030F7A2C3
MSSLESRQLQYLFLSDLLNWKKYTTGEWLGMKKSQVESMKECRMCKEEKMLILKERFCDECKHKRKKESQRRYDEKVKEDRVKKKRRKYEDNFYEIDPSGDDLLPIKFNKISKINAESYRKLFKMNWKEVLDKFGKLEEMQSLLDHKYEMFHKETGSQDVARFSREIGSNYYTIQDFDINRMMSPLGLRFNSYEDEHYRNNMKYLYNKYNRIPLYSEFMENTKIPIPSYVYRYKLVGKVYDQLVNMFYNEKDIREYTKLRLSVKSDIGRENHQGYKYDFDDLEENFRFVFNNYFEDVNEYPTIEIFSKFSNVDVTTYNHRLKMSFTQVAKHYGYPVDAYGSKTEKYVLSTISRLLDTEADTQMTFKWLKSIKGFPLRCDGYYKDHSLIVEYDGQQHFYPIEFFGGIEGFERLQINDAIKNDLIPKHNLTLIRIAYDEPYWDEDFLRMRLYENGIISPNRALITDSQINQIKVS